MAQFLTDPVNDRYALYPISRFPTPTLAQPLNLGGETIRVDLTGGQAVSVPLAPWSYVIHSQVDLYAKSSDSQSLYGLRGLTGGRDAEMYTTTGLEQYEALNPGTGDFSVETLLGGWVPDAINGGELFAFEARNGTDIVGRIALSVDTTVSNSLRTKVVFIDVAGTTVNNVTISVSDWDPTGLRHLCTTLKRRGAGQPLGFVLSVDGSVLYDADLGSIDNGVAGVFGAAPTTNFRAVLGSTPWGSPDFIGDVYWLRYYKRALSAAQVQARALVAQSPNSRVYDAATADMAFELTFQDQAQWADPAQPESSDLTALDPALPRIVFADGSLAAGDVQLAPGGQAATDSSAPIKMNAPTPVVVQGNYLNLLSRPGNSGSVWITPV